MGIIKAAKLAFDYLRYEEEGGEPEVTEPLTTWIWILKRDSLSLS